MQQWRAFYYDGRSALRHDVTVHPHALGLTITMPDGARVEWSLASLRQTQGALAGEPLRIERDGVVGEALVIRDDGFAEELRRQAPGVKLKGPGESSAWKLGLATVVVLAGLLAAYFFGIPALAGQIAAVVPVSWEEALGDQVVSEMAPEDKRCHDPRTVGAVEAIVRKLIAAGPKTPYRYRVFVVNSETVNAFAAPGGDIVVYTGLLSKTQSPEELAGVLAHEIQHVQRRHATKGLIRRASLEILISALTGSHSGIGTVLGTAGSLGLLRYSRADEAEADARGMRLLEAAKADPQGMVRMFKMLQAEAPSFPGALNFLSDHPDTAARIRVMSRMAAEAHYKPVPLLPGVDWHRIAQGCRPRAAE